MIRAADRAKLRAQLTRHEGCVLKPYRDSVGVLTIGVGRNLEHVGIDEDEAAYLLSRDIDRAVVGVVHRFPWVADLTPARQSVLVNMCFNLGLAGLSKFVHTLELVKRGEYDAAADAMLHSKWATQVKGRATELAEQMRCGEWVA